MKISVVITAYNKERTLWRAVESTMKQTWKDIEVIVVEDKSTDLTLGVLWALKDKYPQLKVLLNGENGGAGLSRRRGIKAASGDYILLLDGDDWLEPDYVEALAKRAMADDADMVTGGVSIHADNGGICEASYGDGTVAGDEKILRYFGKVTLFLNGRLVRRELYDKVEYPDRRYIEDVQTCVMLLWWANKNCFVIHCGYHYSYNPESLTHTADRLKEMLYRTLCVTDLVRFFAEHDPRYLQIYDFETAYKTGLKSIAACNPTAETMASYAKEWEELRQFAES